MFKTETIDHNNILDRLKKVYEKEYQNNDVSTIEYVLRDTIDLFEGRKKGFQACDMAYHNIHHTMQTIPPFIDIISGWNKSGTAPSISKDYFDTGIIAVLLHDTGYIKEEGDTEGTGAKYTFTHVQRSIEFADYYLRKIGFERQRIISVQNAIRCTGTNFNLEAIRFTSDEEQIIGYALGTADLLGQMSASEYPEKLHALFKEFDEAYRFEGKKKLHKKGVRIFNNTKELLQNTIHFYKDTTMERFRKMGSVYSYIECKENHDKNPYIEAIEKNIETITKQHL